MNNKTMKLSLPLFFLILLTGCFEVREEVNMKADGSGEVQFVVNLSQSKEKVRTYLTMETVEGYKVPKREDVDASIGKIKATLGQVSGISEVFTKADWSNYIFTITCRFAHVEALNEAIKTVSKQWEKLPFKPTVDKNFSYNNAQFRRIYEYPSKPEEFRQLPSVQRYMLESARFVSIYRFERDIRLFSNKKAQISPSGKAIMLQLPVADLLKGTGTLANTIGF